MCIILARQQSQPSKHQGVSMAESSSLAIAMNIFTAPSAAFAALKERPRVWLPLLLLLGGYAAVSFMYMNSVDLGWFMDAQLAQNPALTEAAARASRDRGRATSRRSSTARSARSARRSSSSARAVPHGALLHDRVVRVARRREAQAVVRVRLLVHAAGRARPRRHAREPDASTTRASCSKTRSTRSRSATCSSIERTAATPIVSAHPARHRPHRRSGRSRCP